MKSVPTLPARVEWRDGGETLTETTRLLSVSLRGATIELSKPPSPGQLIRLTLPALGRGGAASPEATLWALVWGTAGTPSPATRLFPVSLIFCGTDIPRSFAENPEGGYAYVVEDGETFRLQSRPNSKDSEGAFVDRRRESRIPVPVEVTTEILGETGEVVASEITITENVSRGGAALRTTLLVPALSRVRLRCERHGLTLNSIVRACTIGPDNIRRMHLQFIDGQWPIGDH